MYRTTYAGETVEVLGALLNDETAKLGERYRALRTLYTQETEESINEIAKCFTTSSALLKHDCAYLLGQMKHPVADAILKGVVEDLNQQPIVRHEAAASLATKSSADFVQDLLQKYASDLSPEVADTCKLALKKMQWLHSDEGKGFDMTDNPYGTNDPAPPMLKGTFQDWLCLINDESLSLFDKYRVMYSLRKMGGDEAVDALISSLQSQNVLYRHELAFVFGQMKNKRAVPSLVRILEDVNENGIIRHECTESLTKIALDEKGTPMWDECQKILRRFLNDKEQLVRDSCEVALEEMAEESCCSC